jgi:hypothetical protein
MADRVSQIAAQGVWRMAYGKVRVEIQNVRSDAACAALGAVATMPVRFTE